MAEDKPTDEDRKRWREKTEFVPGLVFGETLIPEVRYQVLAGQVYILQVYPDGETGRGLMTPDELSKQLGKPVTKEGWYDEAGKFLGQDPGLE